MRLSESVITMCLETQIRKLAAQGCTRKQAAQSLGLSDSKMKMICDTLQDLEWMRANQSVAKRQSMGCDPAVAERMRRARAARKTPKARPDKYRLDDKEGSLIELMVHFKVMWTVGTVLKRLDSGMSLDEAFSSGRPKQRDWSNCAW